MGYKIYFGNKEFDASEYQAKIFDFIEHGIGNMIISAAAGSSKTTTIVNATRYIPEDKRILFIAFNKDIVEKLKEEVKRDNVHISTFHSLGYSILLENDVINNQTEINEYKYSTFIKENIDSLTKYNETRSLGSDRIHYITNIIKLSEYCRYYLAFNSREIKKIVKLYGLTIVRDEIAVCSEILRWGGKHFDCIDYTDMIWLTNHLNLTTKKHQYDFIFIDEAQDTSIMQQKMIEKCFKRGTRFITVGDDFQKINVWCGSSVDAINNFKKYPNTQEFQLPISYRCPKKVVELAKEYSSNIVAAHNAIEGEVNYDVSMYAPKNNDMVLCRTTAPLIKLHLKYLRNNKKSYIRGFEDIKKEYIELIRNTYSKNIDKNCLTYDGLIPRLYHLLFKEIDRLKNNLNLTDDEVMNHPNVFKLYDNIQGILSISDGLTTTEELLEKINIIFNGDQNNSINLSTIHKAKGLEADNVFILHPNLLPYPFAQQEWEMETERNLIYVAYTRAKKTLNFIEPVNDVIAMRDGVEFKNQMRKNIAELKQKINFNEKNELTEENINTTINYIPQKLGENRQTQAPKSKVKKGGLKFKNLME
jgi:superfamily I DNA/RNA helicase